MDAFRKRKDHHCRGRAQKLVDADKIAGVLEFPQISPSSKCLWRALFPYLAWDPTKELSSFLSPPEFKTKPVVLYFPEFDRAQHHPKIKDFIISLAEDS